MQGLAFSIEERMYLGIHGLYPPAVQSMDLQVCRGAWIASQPNQNPTLAQVQRAIKSIRAQPNDLARYQFLVGIQVRVIVVVVIVNVIRFEIGFILMTID